ncbi:TetR/AcrR family transcriptional regulator [Candidatus Allofournierella excrementavium]|uniref:TetR/AcrR family transcriptional regulator n=1 Tax=Candidatus Allofournierella excrementavium TaxID=2838591 RepID=UPI00374E4FB2
MPANMKNLIAEAAKTLLIQRHVKKLTVTDIVEECHITRQTFYYHFDDIPDLLRWMADEYFEQVMTEVFAQKNGELGLRCFFVMAINIAPYVEHGMKSNYGDELKRTLRQCFQRYFTRAFEEKDLCPACTRAQLKIIMRYHSQAILGLLEDWTEEDTEQLDQIVHTIYRIMTADVFPRQE